MENDDDDENQDILLQKNYYKTDFAKQDVTNIPSFIKWKEYQTKNNIKLVKCPVCWTYEKYTKSYLHSCINCEHYYCQRCLKILDDDRRHEHQLDCCDEGCIICCKTCCSDCCEGTGDLLCLIFGECEDSVWNRTFCEYFLLTLLFLFGTPILFTIKYFKFFLKNKVIDNDCAHWFFTILNLLTNIIYCFLFTFFYIGISFVIFSPSILIYKYIKLIAGNWYYVYHYEIDECPIVQLTVRKFFI